MTMFPGPLRLVFRQSPATYFPNASAAVIYLLRDLFTTARAAGAINTTATEPGGTGTGTQNTRTVTDTNSKLSITASTLTFATGGVGGGDPGLWYGSFTRTTGRAFIGRIAATAGSGLAFGWDTDASGALSDFLRINLGTPSLNTSNGVAVGTSASATNYDMAIILGTNNTYMFIKGGTYTLWSLVWDMPITTSPMFPTIQVQQSTTSVGTAVNARIPSTLLVSVITPYAYDTFTRADGALGSTETTGPDGQAPTARTWTGSSYAISTNKAVNTPATGADVVVNGTFSADTDWNKGAGWTIAAGTAVATAASSDITATVAPLTLGTWYQTAFTQGGFGGGTVNVKLGTTAFPTHGANGTFTETGRATSTALALTGAGLTDTVDNFSALPITLANLFASVVAASADVMVSCTVILESASSGKQAGLVLNLDSTSSPANFIIVYLDGNGNVKADECVAGVYTNKISAAVTYASGAVIRAVRVGTDLRVFYNNAAVGALATMTANTNLNHGVFSTSPLSSVDNFRINGRGTGGEYAALLGY